MVERSKKIEFDVDESKFNKDTMKLYKSMVKSKKVNSRKQDIPTVAEELLNKILAEYNVDETTALNDLNLFLDLLTKKGLL